ncbi:response regulator transcription factor [Candidatus Chloroploca sp. Khr17]|uniref:response regulator n=1 Tax=Candidatus Chloroploca sp. Khr17 TaxID=2496869 RepID=UPI00101C77D4
MIRVLIADDQLLMRDGLASLLNIQRGIDVVATAENGQEAIVLVADLLPDVVLMDVRMPVMDGIEATAEIHRRFPEIKVLMLTTFDDEAYVTGALRAGAFGYVLKNTPALDLAQAIQMTHRGMVQLAPSAMSKLVNSKENYSFSAAMKNDDKNPLNKLTEREVEVLRLVVNGASNKEIADTLVITEGTVKSHISNILNRLEARDRTQAAVIAVKHGLK